MRSIWLLPDRDQTGRIQAVEDECTYSLHELISLKELPPAFILGIPEEIYRSKSGEFFLFAQFVFLTSGSRVFCLSAPAGRDISGRIVSISNLQFLEEGEEPNLKFFAPTIISSEDKRIINKISAGQKENNLELFGTVNKMLEAVKQAKKARSFSSETLILARNRPDWMPQKKRLELSEIEYKKVIWLIFLFILFTAAFYFLLCFQW